MYKEPYHEFDIGFECLLDKNAKHQKFNSDTKSSGEEDEDKITITGGAVVLPLVRTSTIRSKVCTQQWASRRGGWVWVKVEQLDVQWNRSKGVGRNRQ